MRHSVVIAAYNAEKTIAPAVESAITSIKGLSGEVVVVDDGSSDGTERILRSFRKQIRLITLPKNAGRAAARNVAIASSYGEIVSILDADDQSLPNRLLTVEKQFAGASSIDLVFGQFSEVTPDGRNVLAKLPFPTSPHHIQAQLRRGRMPVAHAAASFKRTWFDRLGGYDTQLQWCEDFDLILRGSSTSVYIGIPTPLIIYTRRAKWTPWKYWRQNETFRKAIFARYVDHATDAKEVALDRYLIHSGRPQEILRELVRWPLIQFRDTLHC